MNYVPSKRGTLLVPSGPQGMHLFVILTNPCQNGFHLWVSITTIKPNKQYDAACTFSGGEHSFIQNPSYVYYRLAEQRRSNAILNGVNKGLFVPKEDMEQKYFDAICCGLENSDFIGQWAVDFYRENCDR